MALSIVFVESPLVLEHLVAPFAIVMIVSVVVKEFIIVIKMTTAVLTIGVTRTLHPMLFEALPGSKVLSEISYLHCNDVRFWCIDDGDVIRLQ